MKHYIDKTTKEIFSYESDGSQDDYIKSGLVPISDTALSTLREEQEQARLDALTYEEKRQAEYPSIDDCIHALLDGGDTLTELQAKRTATKTKYPKSGA